MRSRAAIVSAVLGLWACLALAEEARVHLLLSPPLANDVEALPRLAASDEASLRINVRLAELDQETLDYAKGCNIEPPNSFFERNVEIAFAGPRFLSILITDEFYCPGAAHGNVWARPLTFDLATGLETDLRYLFPPDFIPQEPLIGPAANFKFSQRLTDLYLAQDLSLSRTCRAAIERNDGWFEVWLSKAPHGLMLQPSSLSHAEQACAVAIAIPLARLRELGFADLLTQSLAVAAGGVPAVEPWGNAGK